MHRINAHRSQLLRVVDRSAVTWERRVIHDFLLQARPEEIYEIESFALSENLNMVSAQEAYLQDQALMTMTVSSRRSSVFDRENLNPLMESRPKRVFGPLAAFLKSRVGSRWTKVLVELSNRLGTEDRFRAVLPCLNELVEFRAVRLDGLLCYGSGLLKGQPLKAGWRRRLYVCPETGRLLRMPLETGHQAAGCEKCVM